MSSAVSGIFHWKKLELVICWKWKNWLKCRKKGTETFKVWFKDRVVGTKSSGTLTSDVAQKGYILLERGGGSKWRIETGSLPKMYEMPLRKREWPDLGRKNNRWGHQKPIIDWSGFEGQWKDENFEMERRKVNNGISNGISIGINNWIDRLLEPILK